MIVSNERIDGLLSRKKARNMVNIDKKKCGKIKENYALLQNKEEFNRQIEILVDDEKLKQFDNRALEKFLKSYAKNVAFLLGIKDTIIFATVSTGLPKDVEIAGSFSALNELVINLDTDYIGCYNGQNGLFYFATIFHEFRHALQFGAMKSLINGENDYPKELLCCGAYDVIRLLKKLTNNEINHEPKFNMAFDYWIDFNEADAQMGAYYYIKDLLEIIEVDSKTKQKIKNYLPYVLDDFVISNRGEDMFIRNVDVSNKYLKWEFNKVYKEYDKAETILNWMNYDKVVIEKWRKSLLEMKKLKNSDKENDYER